MKKLDRNLKKFCLFVNVDWFVLSHFTDYITKIVAKNIDVTVLTLNTGRCDEIRALGVNVEEIDLNRGYANLFSELKSLIKIYKVLRSISPDTIEFITIKAVLYGGLIAKILKINKRVFYMSGLGTIFTYKTTFGQFKAYVITCLYKFVMHSKSTEVIVENSDDKQLFSSVIGIAEKRIHLIPGVGIDLNKFAPEHNYKTSPANLRVGLVSRLLYDKGILEFIEAAKICKTKRPDVEFLLAGDIDPTNPASLSQNDLIDFKRHNFVKFLGHRKDVATLMKTFDIFVLPSYREGFPKVIMEAAATGLPVVTTDVTGCRSAVENKETGFIVPSKNAEALADSIVKLIDSAELRQVMGHNARKFAELNFNVIRLSHTHINVWNSI